VTDPRFDPAVEVEQARAALAARGSPERAAGAKAYLKSELDFLGVDAVGLRATAREIVESHPELDHDRLAALVRALWKEPEYELRALGVALPELRAGRGDFALFARFAARMVDERQFFIRKAIGWVLRDVSRKRPELAFGFLAEHIDRVSGLTLREGAKYLTEAQRQELARLRLECRA